MCSSRPSWVCVDTGSHCSLNWLFVIALLLTAGGLLAGAAVAAVVALLHGVGIMWYAAAVLTCGAVVLRIDDTRHQSWMLDCPGAVLSAIWVGVTALIAYTVATVVMPALPSAATLLWAILDGSITGGIAAILIIFAIAILAMVLHSCKSRN